MLDIDHFKRVNDTHGHAAGDLVLAGVAKILAGLCRKEDMVFRYGGEEFCILCPGTDLRVAADVAERIRRAIGMGVFAYGDRKLTVTVSIGIAALSPAHTDADALMKDADRALYRAKQKGRDRVERCSP
jgi:diguanylate cyclase (GGDEF)-like protein